MCIRERELYKKVLDSRSRSFLEGAGVGKNPKNGSQEPEAWSQVFLEGTGAGKRNFKKRLPGAGASSRGSRSREQVKKGPDLQNCKEHRRHNFLVACRLFISFDCVSKILNYMHWPWY